MSKQGYTGISYPFRFGSKGGVEISTTDENDFSHIKDSIRQIIVTHFGERVFSPDFGSNVMHSIFSNQGINSEIGILKFNIQESIERWDTRVKVLNIEISEVDTELERYTSVEVEIFVIKYLRSETVTVEIDSKV